MKGRPAWVRCRPCERRLPSEIHEGIGGKRWAAVNARAFNVKTTGRQKLTNRRGRGGKHRYEWKCRECGHTWWSTRAT